MVIKDEIIEVLKNTLDPELGIDLYTLGLIYKIEFSEKKQDLKILTMSTMMRCHSGAKF